MAADGDDAEVHTEPLSIALTRPPMKWGVRYEVFALNGMISTIIFIASSSFLSSLGAFVIVHGISAYLCQRDPYIFHILERRFSKKRAIRNASFWGAGSYSP